jgi:hypothetical protein
MGADHLMGSALEKEPVRTSRQIVIAATGASWLRIENLHIALHAYQVRLIKTDHQIYNTVQQD